jgi:hypothetical protein
MPQFAFDTDHLTLFDFGNAQVVAQLALQPAGSVALSIVVAENTFGDDWAPYRRPARPRFSFIGTSCLPNRLNSCTSFPSFGTISKARSSFRNSAPCDSE